MKAWLRAVKYCVVRRGILTRLLWTPIRGVLSLSDKAQAIAKPQLRKISTERTGEAWSRLAE